MTDFLQVVRPDDAVDGERGAELVPAGVERVAEQRRSSVPPGRTAAGAC